jgi:hypothetical protein
MSCFYNHPVGLLEKSDCFCLEPLTWVGVLRMSSKFLALDVFWWHAANDLDFTMPLDSLISSNQAARTLRPNDFCLKSRTAWRVVARHWEPETELRANWLFALTGSVWGRGRRWRPPTGPYLGAGRTNPSAPAGRFPSRACIHPSRRYR